MAVAAALVTLGTQPEIAPRLWTPKRVLLTVASQKYNVADTIAERAKVREAEIVRLSADRLPRIKTYAEAKGTLAVVVSPPSSFKLNPIPPSADWQFHLAQGCPAHCQYCYLAGSLSGPPLTRVYANVDEILENLRRYLGTGSVTSTSSHRAHEGTTFECSCYTDPLALEHLTGSLARAITFFGAWDAPVQLRWTTKFDGVDDLLALEHRRRTRIRFSVNASSPSRLFEGGTPSVARRLEALRKVALSGYPVGLTVAPIMDITDFESEYRELFQRVRRSVDAVPNLDITAELITHRFTQQSKQTLLSWYPKTPLEMDEARRTEKRTKFGSRKHVYPPDRMKCMRATITGLLADILPECQVLYWT